MNCLNSKIGKIAKLYSLIYYWKADVVESYCLVISVEGNKENYRYIVLDDTGKLLSVIHEPNMPNIYPRVDFNV
jgi:hypothetical protein